MNARHWLALVASTVSLTAGIAFAQATAPAAAPAVPQYGANITADQAKKVLAAAEADSRGRSWPMAISIVDNAGMLVAFIKLDNTQNGSVMISQDKAVSAAMLRRPTKAIQEGLAAGGAGLRFLGLRYASPIEGGLPLVVDGKIIGAIGVSGMAADQDGVIAKAGADALLK
jgi:glc operon protein GlcG